MGSFELERLGRTTLNTFLLLLVVPLFKIIHIQIGSVILGAHPGKEAFWVSVMALMLLAYTFGQNLFQLERKDGAWEYLLTFPKNRWNILASKVWPRLAILLLVTLCLEVFILIWGAEDLAGGNFFFLLIDPLFFPAWVFFLFLLGIGNSLFEQKNLMAVLNLLTLFAWGFTTAAFLPVFRSRILSFTLQRLPGFTFLVSGIPIILIYALAFLSAYRRWDFFAPVKEARSFLWRTLLPLGLISLMSMVKVIFHFW
jgi:ABC-type transport system involved in multi-copper enzyme maturation permease subunit